jgi:hypothetical protein
MFVSASRREVLKTLTTGACVLAAPAVVTAQPVGDVPVLRVSVHRPGGEHLARPASVVVRSVAGETLRLTRTPRVLVYSAAVAKGSYRLLVQADGFAPVDQPITVAGEGSTISVYLGQPHWPAFRMGRSLIPFEPREDLLAVALSGRSPSKARWQVLLDELDRLGLAPYPDPQGYLAAAGSLAIFRSARTRIFGGASGPLARVSALFAPWKPRIGMPIDTRPGRIKILDSRYVVSFAAARTSEWVLGVAREHGADAQRVSGLDNTWLLDFGEPANYLAHLAAAERLLGLDGGTAVVYAEPSLVVELQNHACDDAQTPPSCTPAQVVSASADPWSSCQQNLALQGVPEAWCFLEQQLGAASRQGSATVCIATVDAEGINVNHPDVGAQRVEYVSFCQGCDPMPVNPHGMGVFGIVGARSGNNEGVSGIAPGAHHVAVRLRWVWNDPASYAQVLVWLGGLPMEMDFAAPPLTRPASIIACSHGIADLPTPSPIAHAFDRLISEGRPGRAGAPPRGTVLVYSAGNESTEITGTQALAADPRVIAVGNTLAPVDGVEVREMRSNYGYPLSLCAQGDNAPSLLADPAGTVLGVCTPPSHPEGAFEFGGTSAACPMVAAAAALMLSLNEDLTWFDVRQRLRQTARCVDAVNGQWSNHRSYWYGSGRLDVHGAVRAAVGPAQIALSQPRSRSR